MSAGPTDDRRPNVAAELQPHVDAPDIEAVNEIGDRLIETPPIPRAGFRAELKAHLIELQARHDFTWRPKRLGATITACGGGALSLLALAALGATGVGPLG